MNNYTLPGFCELVERIPKVVSYSVELVNSILVITVNTEDTNDVERELVMKTVKEMLNEIRPEGINIALYVD